MMTISRARSRNLFCPVKPLLAERNRHPALSQRKLPYRFACKHSFKRRLALSATVDSNLEVAFKNVTEDPEKFTDKLLEWDELCSHVCRFATTTAGKKSCRDLERGRTCQETMELQKKTRAIEILIDQMRVDFDFGPLSTDLVDAAIDRCSKGGMLSGQFLSSVAHLLSAAQTLKTAISNPFKKSELFRDVRLTTDVFYLPWSETEINLELLNLITFAIDEDGGVKDNASEQLTKTRNEFRRIRKKLETLMRSLDGEVVERSGRICLSIPSASKIPNNALVLDTGSSGKVYVEPRSALGLNNDLSVAYAEMKNAEESILWNLTSQVFDNLDHLRQLYQLVVELDVAIARCRYTKWIDGEFPQFSYDGSEDFVLAEDALFLSLINLRHPLLLGQSLIYKEARARTRRVDDFKLEPPIPNDVILNSETKALIITGPNAGGKTATLKALGLCALMAKAGLGLPATQPVWIPFYSSVLADIGDEQSLTSSLSTFSGHLHRIQNLRRVADGRCLILLDELGTGTDPKEGAALGVALLMALVRGGPGGALTTLVSTHHGLLKNLAYDHQFFEDGRGYSVFENACMEFDDEALAPTYRLIMGVPGQSNALNIASRLGMDLRIIGAAGQRLGRQHISENYLIAKIQGEQEALEDISHTIEKLQKKVLKTKSLIRESERRLASMEYQLLTQQADDYMHAYEHGKSELELLKHKQSVISESEPTIEVKQETREEDNWSPEIGDTVFVPEFGKEATVIKFASKNKAIVRAGFLTIEVERTSLQPL